MTPQSEMEHLSTPYGKPGAPIRAMSDHQTYRLRLAALTQSEKYDELDESIEVEVHCDCAVQVRGFCTKNNLHGTHDAHKYRKRQRTMTSVSVKVPVVAGFTYGE